MEKYQITKTIRFKLEPVQIEEFEKQVQNIENVKEEEANLAQLVSNAQDLSKLLKEYIYTDPNHEKKKFKNTVIVHFRWLKEFTKDKYFEWINQDETEQTTNPKTLKANSFSALGSLIPQKKKKNISKEKRYKLSKINYLQEVFENFLKDWDSTVQTLSSQVAQPKEKLTRKAEIGKVVLKFSGRNMLLFLEHFLSESKDKDSSHLEVQLQEKIKTFKEVLEKAQTWVMPSQSTGIELAKASFNYYTINKKEKDFDNEKEKIEKELCKLIKIKSDHLNFLKGGNIKIIKEEYNQKTKQKKYTSLFDVYYDENEKKEKLKNTPNGVKVDLDKLYKILKIYRATQKSEFISQVSNGMNYEEAIKKFPLFEPNGNNGENKQAFQRFVELTKKIESLKTEREKLKQDSDEWKQKGKELSQARQNRGKLFFQGSSKESKERFQKYLKFCEIYKDIAMKRGRLIARLKGIEKEKIDSARLQYWAFLLEKDNRHQVVLIPKTKAKDAYQKISCFGETQTGSPAVYYFESLTYRALKKLCFGVNGNTFIPEIKEELKKKNKWNYEEKDFGEHIFKIKNGQEEIRDEKKLISFYKDVLQTDYVRKNREDGNIVLPSNFDNEVLKPDFNTEQEFRIALEKCCYTRKRIVPKGELDKILSTCDAQVFSITSYDLQKVNKTNLKAHTKLWLDFWNKENEKQSFPIRLNPEIKIFWREPKASQVAKYGKGTELYDEQKKNRYLYPQYTLITTFLENALQSEINYRFLDAEKKKENVKKFNEEVKKFLKPKEELWLYGIDTGIVELVSLCLIKKDGTPQMFEVLELKEEFLNYEKTGFPKEGETKKYKAIQNLSYFLNKELYKETFKDDKFEEEFHKIFEVKQVPALDLSVAKVISGRIVINGDIAARLNLTLSNARRKIVEALIQNPNIQLSEEDYKIKIGNEDIFLGRKEFNAAKSWDEIKEKLNESFQKDKDNPARAQEDINKHRQVIAANVTGIIHFLYKKFPGIITIEYLDQTTTESHRQDFEGIVDNPVEKALYRKFQTEGLVPPVSELWSMKAADSQVGIIYYADSNNPKKGGHGLRCPKCGEKVYKSKDDSRYDADKKAGIFECNKTNCGFHNRNNPMGLEGLDSNDKVAAYNIAKRGLEILN